jgi:predicted MFS family arabinose efflux permease
MPVSADRTRTRLATRLSFVSAGFAVACWAPLVPFAKASLGVDDGTLGLLLLCLGAGSVIAMPFAGILSTRLGSKPIILAGGFGTALFLPLLALVERPVPLGITLLLFGASLGSLDVAMNLHAVDVEKAAGQPMMSGFHALFSIGGFAGSGFMTVMLSNQVSPFLSALASCILVAITMSLAAPYLMRGSNEAPGPIFVVPRGIVLVIALLAAVSFLVEGALLDWSALFVVGAKLVTAAKGGIGYMLFSIAMTLGRLSGDRVVSKLGDRNVLLAGSVTAIAGFTVLLVFSPVAVALAGFVLIGLGAANIVPILFRRAGTQRVMPAGLAIAAVTTAGYAGMLIGPAAMGFVAHASGLRSAFWLLATLLCFVPAFSGSVTRLPSLNENPSLGD